MALGQQAVDVKLRIRSGSSSLVALSSNLDFRRRSSTPARIAPEGREATKLRIPPPTRRPPNEALLMIRHAGNSARPVDQATRQYSPARKG